MKTGLSAAGLFFTTALISAAGAATVTMSPPPAQNQKPAKIEPQPRVLPAPIAPPPAAQPAAKADCPCPIAPKAAQAAAPRRAVRNYHYAAAAPWHQRWRVVPPVPDGPPPGFYAVAGLRIDNFGWTGGVGYGADGGGGGGYGPAYFANGGGIENGPTYNSYGQSFQYNPSQAGPFQPRLMGGFAPQSSR